MHIEKLKGTLVDFNHLEHVLDNVEHVGTWQLELRKRNDDPLELDELDPTRQEIRFAATSNCARSSTPFHHRTEIHPNRIVFHDSEEMSHLLGVGALLKEDKIVDHRPGAARTNGHTKPEEVKVSALNVSSSWMVFARPFAKPDRIWRKGRKNLAAWRSMPCSPAPASIPQWRMK